ncbi:MAG: heparinase II/III family protein [Myxococcota bacterium]
MLAWFAVLVGCSADKKSFERPANAEEELLVELAQLIDPNTSGLEEFFDQIGEQDVDGAKQTLLNYFREKEIPSWALPDPLPIEQQTLINGLAAWRGNFSFQGVEGKALLEDGTIDWESRGPRNDPEWTWFLHRHFFLREMMVLYQAQGHHEFVAQVNNYLLDWFWRFPPPESQSFSASWRALEAARRYVDSWLPVYAELRGHPAFSEEAELAVIVGAARHAQYLRNFHHFGGNHLVTEMMSLAAIAAVWPEFSDSKEWMGYAVDRALEELERQVYPDGAHKELANHYQWIAGSSFQRLYRILVGSGANDSLDQMKPRMEKLWDYYARVTRPDGTGPLNNDSDLEPNASQLLSLAEFYGRTLFIPGHLGLAEGGVEFDTQDPRAQHALETFAGSVPGISPVAFDLQGYANNRVMFNALISRLNEAIVGELTLDQAYERMVDDVAKQIAEQERQ